MDGTLFLRDNSIASTLINQIPKFFAIVNVPTLGIALVYFFKGIEAGPLGLNPTSTIWLYDVQFLQLAVLTSPIKVFSRRSPL